MSWAGEAACPKRRRGGGGAGLWRGLGGGFLPALAQACLSLDLKLAGGAGRGLALAAYPCLHSPPAHSLAFRQARKKLKYLKLFENLRFSKGLKGWFLSPWLSAGLKKKYLIIGGWGCRVIFSVIYLRINGVFFVN